VEEEYYHSMRLHFAVLIVLLVALLNAQPGQIPELGPDSAKVIAVAPPDSIQLRDGQPVEFEVSIHYLLRSRDRAVLAVYAERYAAAGERGGCDNSVLHQTEGGANILLKRGEGDVKTRFRWHEEHSKVPRGAASLAIGMNLWTEEYGRPVKPALRVFPRSSCRTIEP
jgi:hypothetical protein